MCQRAKAPLFLSPSPLQSQNDAGKQRVFSSVKTAFAWSVGEWFDSSPVRRNRDEIPLLAIVLGQFEEADATRLRPIIDNFGVDYSRHLSCVAEALASGLAHANDIGQFWIA